MSGTAVEVNGIPHVLPDDRMLDKLTIHFLRPRNGGGEVDRVLFPSDRPGQAFVIFEEPEVAARVLRSNHVMELQKHKFPLSLKAADRPEADLPVEATLDMRLFSGEAEVLRLVSSHGLLVTEKRRDQLRVRGSFLQLRAAKAQLRHLLLRDDPLPTWNCPPSPAFNGHAHRSGAGVAGSTGGSTRHDTGGASVHAGSWSPGAVGGGQAMFGPPSPSLSPSPRPPGSPPAPPQGLPPVRGASPAPWAAAAEVSSFVTDADVLRYAQAFKRKDVDSILENHGALMSVETAEDAGFSQVALEGGESRAAAAKLQALLTELTDTLRTQEIPLTPLDHDSQVTVGKRIQEYLSESPSVLISQVGQTVRLVGPPRDGHELKRRLLRGEPPDRPPAGQRGRSVDRGGGLRERRSASLPRTLKGEDGGARGADRHPVVPSPARQGRSTSRSQGEAGAPLGTAGTWEEPRPAVAESGPRRRSSSESRGRATERRGQGAAPPPRQGAEEQAPSGGGPRSPPEKKQSVTDWLTLSSKEIMQKLRKSKKK